MDSVMPYLLALIPTVGVGTLFYFVIKSILEGDRRERLAQAKWEAEHDRREAALKASEKASEKPADPSTGTSSGTSTGTSGGTSTGSAS